MAFDPTDPTKGTFRAQDWGGIPVPVNTHAPTSHYFVDRSRLKTSTAEKYEPSDSPMKPGKWTMKTETADIVTNARRAAGEMGAYSSYKQDDGRGGCGNSSSCGPYSLNRNPLTRDRGDE